MSEKTWLARTAIRNGQLYYGSHRMSEDIPSAEHRQDGEARPSSYRIQIDKDHLEIENPIPTGRELLVLAGKLPPEQFGLYLKVRGGQPKRIGLDDPVDLRAPGTERFVTLPLDQTEGSS